jgi:hypothetical protein
MSQRVNESIGQWVNEKRFPIYPFTHLLIYPLTYRRHTWIRQL